MDSQLAMGSSAAPWDHVLVVVAHMITPGTKGLRIPGSMNIYSIYLGPKRAKMIPYIDPSKPQPK